MIATLTTVPPKRCSCGAIPPAPALLMLGQFHRTNNALNWSVGCIVDRRHCADSALHCRVSLDFTSARQWICLDCLPGTLLCPVHSFAQLNGCSFLLCTDTANRCQHDPMVSCGCLVLRLRNPPHSHFCWFTIVQILASNWFSYCCTSVSIESSILLQGLQLGNKLSIKWVKGVCFTFVNWPPGEWSY